MGRPSESGRDSPSACTRRFSIPATRWPRLRGPFNAVTVESETITEITMSGTGSRGASNGERRARRRDQRDDPARLDAAHDEQLEIVQDVVSAFYLHLEVADEPGVLAQVAEVLASRTSRSSPSCRKGWATRPGWSWWSTRCSSRGSTVRCRRSGPGDRFGPRRARSGCWRKSSLSRISPPCARSRSPS